MQTEMAKPEQVLEYIGSNGTTYSCEIVDGSVLCSLCHVKFYSRWWYGWIGEPGRSPAFNLCPECAERLLPEASMDLLDAIELCDLDVETAAAENRLRRKLAVVLNAAKEKRGLSIRGLAEAMGTSKSQVQRMLHRELGGNLTLRTLVRAARVLGCHLRIEFIEKEAGL